MPRANSLDRVVTECPEAVRIIDSRLRASGHQVFVIGGAVRDALLETPISDWDLVTSAASADLMALFQDVRHFTLRHSTVTFVCGTEHYEVTPFKGKDLYEDLALRDFTVDAMAFDLGERRLFDLFRGQTDLRQRTIRAVGDPEARFREDPLRLLRAVRLAGQLGFTIEPQTLTILTGKAAMIQEAAAERVREELMKILLSSRPSTGFRLLARTCLLRYIIPELLEGYGKRQTPYHRHTIFKHILLTVDRVNPEPVLRLAALFHDIGKPRVRRKINGTWHFYGHEKTSAEMTETIMERLRFSTEKIQDVVDLVRHHMLAYDPSWTDGAVRRLIARVGQDIIGGSAFPVQG